MSDDRASVPYPNIAILITSFVLLLAVTIAFLHLSTVWRFGGGPPDLTPPPSQITGQPLTAATPTNPRIDSALVLAGLDSIHYVRALGPYEARTAALKRRYEALKASGAADGLMDLMQVFTASVILFVFGAGAARALVSVARARELDAETRLLEAKKSVPKPP